MPPVKRKPMYFRYTSFTPRNRKQQIRIRIGQPPDRPLRLTAYDAVKREEMIREHPDWLIEHRRGPHRPRVGIDYQESRAIPRWRVRGSLPERIVYMELLKRRYIPDLDFDFQSSMDGGRQELGGMVADFVFWDRRIILQVQGFSHRHYLQMRKDEQQAGILASYGFSVLYLDEKIVYNAPLLEQWFRRFLDPKFRFLLVPDTEEHT